MFATLVVTCVIEMYKDSEVSLLLWQERNVALSCEPLKKCAGGQVTWIVTQLWMFIFRETDKADNHEKLDMVVWCQHRGIL